MQDWLKTQLADGLPAFAGSSLSGTLSVRQELATVLLNDLLREPGAGPRANTGNDFAGLVKFVKEVGVRADAGAVMIDFKISV
jgi:hypothetical protein